MAATPSFDDRPRYLRDLKEFLAIPSVAKPLVSYNLLPMRLLGRVVAR